MSKPKFYGHTAMSRDLAQMCFIKLCDAEDILNILLKNIEKNLKDGNIVRFKHLFSVKLARCPEREMYSYNSNKRIRIPARRRVRISPAHRLEDELRAESR